MSERHLHPLRNKNQKHLILALSSIFMLAPVATAAGAPTPGAAKADKVEKTEKPAKAENTAGEAKQSKSESDTKAVKLVNEKIVPLLNAGYESLSKGDFQKAEQTLEKAVTIDDSSISAKRYLAFAQLKNGNSLKALKTLQSLAKLTQPGPLDWYIFGEAYLSASAAAHAKSCFNQALTLSPEYSAAKAGLIRSQIKLREFDEAFSTSQDALSKATDTSVRKYFLSLYQRSYNLKEAAKRTFSNPVPESEPVSQPQETSPIMIQPTSGN